MLERLDLIEKRYKEIEDLLISPEVLSDIKKSKELSIEMSSIEDVVMCFKWFRRRKFNVKR